MIILAGLFEKDENDKLYKPYVCVDGNGLIAKHRKIEHLVDVKRTISEAWMKIKLVNHDMNSRNSCNNT